MKNGKTPVLSAEEARGLLDGIDLSTLVGLRDRALIGVLVFSFARITAAVSMRVEDRAMTRATTLRMIKRRARQAGLLAEICAHSFRGNRGP